jgi:hypothetical protein
VYSHNPADKKVLKSISIKACDNLADGLGSCAKSFLNYLLFNLNAPSSFIDIMVFFKVS